MYNLEHRAIFSFESWLLKLNAKQVCMFAFIVYAKVHIVTTVASDVSGDTIIIDLNLLIQWAFPICIQDYG